MTKFNPNFAIGFRIETKKAEMFTHKKVREYFTVFKDFFRSKNEGIFCRIQNPIAKSEFKNKTSNPIAKLKSNSGFTLLEILIGLTITVMVITTVYETFNIGLKTYKRQEEQNYIHENVRLSLNMISRDLRCAYNVRNNSVFIGAKDEKDSTSDKLTFVTYLQKFKSQEGGLAKISYYVDNDPSTPETGLVIENFGFPMPPVNTTESQIVKNSKKTELAPLVKSIYFRYFDGKSWLDSWSLGIKEKDGAIRFGGLPLAVEVKITINTQDKKNSSETFSTIVPVFCRQQW